jgi:dTDP-4-dehydrorhamnose reductase
MATDKQKVMVTGLSGLVGSRFRQLFSDQFELQNLDLSEGVDITNAEQVENIFAQSDAGAVIHLAAFTNVSGAHEQNGDVNGVCYKINVGGTRTIAEAAKKHTKYLIHISTDYVFDGTKEEPYTEEDVPHPIEWYGMTKLMAEEVIKQTLTDYVILRLAFPYQAKPLRPDFLAGMMEKMKAGTLPPLFTDHVLTPTFVDDVATVFAACITKRPKGIYHMVGSSSHTDFEIGTMVKEVFGIEADIKAGSLGKYLQANPRPYQKTMRVSNEKLKRELGLPMHSLQEGLEEIKAQLTPNS